MSYVSAQAKVYADSRYNRPRPYTGIRHEPRDWNETSFGGKGCLTKEQYERGMALSRKMRTMSEW